MAKRDYLNADISDFKKHPYFWSGLVLVGNEDALHRRKWYRTSGLYILLTFAIGIFLIIRRQGNLVLSV